jgi:hypothetical protein
LKVRRLVLAAGLMAGLVPAGADAQSAWLERTHPKTVRLELARPSFEGQSQDFPTFASFLGARFPLGREVSFVAELAMALAKQDDDVCGGNPYFGIDTHRGEGMRGGWMEVGLRLPVATVDGDATEVGLGADLDRWEAFVPDAITVRVAAHWSAEPRQGAGFDVRLAPTLWLPETFEGEPEVFAVYGGQFRFRSETARGGIALAGRWLLSGDGGFDDAAIHEVEAAANFLRGSFRPGLTLRIPLDGSDSLLGASLDSVVGVTLDFVP